MRSVSYQMKTATFSVRSDLAAIDFECSSAWRLPGGHTTRRWWVPELNTTRESLTDGALLSAPAIANH